VADSRELDDSADLRFITDGDISAQNGFLHVATFFVVLVNVLKHGPIPSSVEHGEEFLFREAAFDRPAAVDAGGDCFHVGDSGRAPNLVHGGFPQFGHDCRNLRETRR